MKLTIHRGTDQIGGCVTEIESGDSKVFIDFGAQLPGTTTQELNPIDGLTCGNISKSALFITHYHGDHIGKICDTVADLPIYIGETALKIYTGLESRLSRIPDPNESDKHKRIIERIKTIKTFAALETIRIGEIAVTPLFIDHSAFDAYMFIVEADGKRILHTGDFRGHGFRCRGLIPTLRKYAANIDYVISEGSNIQRPDAAIETEQALQERFESRFLKNKYNFVLVSSTNIDRIFALYHAAKRAGLCFVCDGYQKSILKIVSDNHKKYSDFYNIDYDQSLHPAGRFIVVSPHAQHAYSFNGKLKPYLEQHGFCILIRQNPAFQPLMEEYVKSHEGKIYYSMWNGYLDSAKRAFNGSLHDFLNPYDIEYMHTSGHADAETLKTVFETVQPKGGIIPIHTEAPESFKEQFRERANVILLHDGETFEAV